MIFPGFSGWILEPRILVENPRYGRLYCFCFDYLDRIIDDRQKGFSGVDEGDYTALSLHQGHAELTLVHAGHLLGDLAQPDSQHSDVEPCLFHSVPCNQHQNHKRRCKNTYLLRICSFAK